MFIARGIVWNSRRRGRVAGSFRPGPNRSGCSACGSRLSGNRWWTNLTPVRADRNLRKPAECSG